MPLPLTGSSTQAVAPTAITSERSPSAASERVTWVDTAKGICIILVVLLHSTHGVETALNTTTWLHSFVEFAKPFRMPDFFLLSGLFMARALGRTRDGYIDAKVTHFVYFYVLWTLLQVGLKESALLLDAGPRAFAVHLAYRLFVAPIGVMWFLYILVAFFLIGWAFRRHPAWLLALAIPLHLFDDEISLALAPVLGAGDGLLWEFCSRLVFFVIGWMGAPLLFQLVGKARRQTILIVGLLLLWVLVNGTLVALGLHQTNWIGLLLGLLGACAVVLFSNLITEGSVGQLLRYAGSHSLIVFSTFFLGMAATRTVLLKLLPQADASLIALAVFAGALATPFLLAWLIQWTGRGKFLIERPRWARRRPVVTARVPVLQPAP